MLTRCLAFVSYSCSARQYSAPQNYSSATRSSSVPSSSANFSQPSTARSARRQPTVPRVDHDVFWQAVFYLGALYVCWPILLYSFSIAQWDEKYYAFHVVFFICSPLQGFLNAMVYFRPKVVKSLRDRQQQRRRGQTTTENTRQSPSEEAASAPPQQTEEAECAPVETVDKDMAPSSSPLDSSQPGEGDVAIKDEPNCDVAQP